jgi:hypothetical protein
MTAEKRNHKITVNQKDELAEREPDQQEPYQLVSNTRIEVSTLDVHKRAVRIAAMAILILTLSFALRAQAQSGVACDSCSANCTDQFPLQAGCVGAGCGAKRAACVAQCKKTCTNVKPTSPPSNIYPKFVILDIVYAPPGCSGSTVDKCVPQGSVSYASNSTTGTKLSASSSFLAGTKVTVGVKDVWNASASFQDTATDSTSETITKSKTFTLSGSGTQDGVDHDLDEFVLLTDPVINLQYGENSIKWSLGAFNWDAHILIVTAGQLKNPSVMQAGLASQFNSLGFTNSDFQTILSQDPFVNNPAAAIDSGRYSLTAYQLSYTPPDPAECTNGVCPCVTEGEQLSNTTLDTIDNSFQSQYSVGLSSGGLGSLIGLTVDDTWTWTNTVTTENTQQNSQTATLTVACPSPSYNGPVAMNIYWDALYGTFLFAPVVDTVLMQQGVITSSAGKPEPGDLVELAFNGKTYRTFADYRGRYRFVMPSANANSAPAQGELSVKGEQRTVPLRSAATTEVRLQ